ncbi:MAG: helix-turn-helix transcriptional regulator [Gammaproteobacteria bacterium]
MWDADRLARTIASSVRHRRSACGLSIRGAAKEIGISPTTLCRIESNKHPDLVTMTKLFNWLDPRAAPLEREEV